MIIETKRLILRPWTEQDAPDLFLQAKNPNVGPSAGWRVHTSLQDSREIIGKVLSDPETYAVCLKGRESVIGSIGLMIGANSRLGLAPSEAELGFWIGEPYWGQGLIPEAAQRLIRRGFEELALTKIWCAYFGGNEKSKRVQEKCGFRYLRRERIEVGLFPKDVRDHYINCLTKEQWKKDAANTF